MLGSLAYTLTLTRNQACRLNRYIPSCLNSKPMLLALTPVSHISKLPSKSKMRWAESSPSPPNAVSQRFMLRSTKDSSKVLAGQKSWLETLSSSIRRMLSRYSLFLMAAHSCPECRSTWRLFLRRSSPRVTNVQCPIAFQRLLWKPLAVEGLGE